LTVPRRLFVQRDLEAMLPQGQRGDDAADAGAGDQDMGFAHDGGRNSATPLKQLQLAETAFETLLAPTQRLINCFR
jgi:hypothetical protein